MSLGLSRLTAFPRSPSRLPFEPQIAEIGAPRILDFTQPRAAPDRLEPCLGSSEGGCVPEDVSRAPDEL